MRTRILATLFTSVTLGAIACGGDDTPVAEDAGEARVDLDWRNCGAAADRDVECAEVSVPLDHDAPEAGNIDIAINRIKADPFEPYRGVLFINPGGPGASGKEFATDWVSNGLMDLYAPGFDIVGFDPRGVATSGERGCGPAPSAPMAASEMSPLDHGMDEYVDAVRSLGARCANAWGPLFGKLGSNQVVRDMDRLRQALGQTKLNYLGISYGTRLGALYAHEFPESTGLMILDGAMPPDTDLMALTRATFEETVALQEVFFEDCASGELDCPPNPRQLFAELIAAGEDLGVGEQLAQRWGSSLAYPESRGDLPGLLAKQASEPSSDWLMSYLAQPGVFDGIGLVASFSTTCEDATTEPPSLDQAEALYDEFAARNEMFAYQALDVLMCAGWPVTRDPVPVPTAIDAPPSLVIGGTQDPLTPLAEARAMTAALGNATLLISNHYGHSATANPTNCIYGAVRNYLARGELPPSGTVCE